MRRARTTHSIVLLTVSSLLITSSLIAVQATKRTPEVNLRRPFSASSSVKTRHQATYSRLPLRFEANLGQADSTVRFLTHTGGYQVSLSPTEASFSLNASSETVKMAFPNANPNPQIKGCDELPGKTNYLIGSDPANWRLGIPSYAKVRYADVYPGVDLIYYGNQRRLEYDFVIDPGADPNWIKLKFTGAQQLSINDEGDLVLRTDHGAIRQLRPVVYQETNGTKQYVTGHYKLTPTNEVAFNIGAYDTSKTLIIDPVFLYSTYFGGPGEEVPFGLTVDSAGSAYVTGYEFAQRQRAFVAKLNATGTALSYLTYFGGNGDSVGYGIAVDAHGNAFTAGYTRASDFPTKNPLQANRKGWANAFVAKLDVNGLPVYSTYLGGSDQVSGHGDIGTGIAVNSAGEAYLTGETTSSDFPTVNAFQPVKGGLRDCFVAKLNAAGSALLFSTYLGGSNTEGGNITSDSNSTNPGNRIAVDSTGAVYVTGYTFSTNFPVVNALQPSKRGESDVFVTKLGPTGAPVYSTYLGGSGTGNDFAHGDYAYGIAVDSLQNVYVVGDTTSNDLSTSNAFQRVKNGARDAFLVKLNAPGNAIVYATYLGGSSSLDHAFGVAVDAAANVYVTGVTDSTNFPVVNLLQPVKGAAKDAFVCKFNSAGSALVYSSYVGGGGADSGSAIAVDEVGNVFLTGWTTSTNFPTTDPLQAVNGGQFDTFIAKVDSVVFSVIAIQTNRGGNGGEVSVNVFGGGFQSGASVKLQAPGQPDINGRNPIVRDSSTLTATFDLRGAPTGVRDVVVLLSDGSSTTLRNGFSVEEGGSSELSLNVIGRSPVRANRNSKFETLLNNRGNIDSGPFIIWIAVPESVNITADVPDLEDLNGLTSIPTPIDGFIYHWFLVDKLNAGQVRTFSFDLKSSNIGQFELRAGLFDGNLILNQTTAEQPIKKSVQQQSALSKALLAASASDDPQMGDLVFRLSTKGARTGHVGVYDGNGFVIDLIPDGLNGPFGHYRRTPLKDWKSEPNQIYVGAARQKIDSSQAQRIADQANALFNTKGSEPVSFFAPPVLGDHDCVSTVADIYRSAGVTPLWSDWYPPGAVFELLTPNKWPETAAVWKLMNLENTRLIERGLLGLLQPKVTYPIRTVAAIDPNDKAGPLGTGTARYIFGGESLAYVVYFENVESATAAAQEVVITDQLDLSTLEAESFAFGPIIIGDKKFIPPPASSEFIGTVDVRPANNLIVKVVARLNKETGLVTWKFSSLDPVTGLPTDDPLAGFLPPNTNPPNGEGSVFFTVNPKSGLQTGTEVRNQASIVFDENAAIQTSTWLNTFDNSKPTSSVLPLPATQNSSTFTVKWFGTDAGSGIKDYTIFVSQNGQAFSPWLTNVSATDAVFTGQTGSSYSFYSIARDFTNNVEDAKNAAEASTLIANPILISCPADMVRPNDTGKDSAVVNYPPPTLSDNRPNVTINCAPASGTAFPVGATNVACTAVETSSSQASCDFRITVNDMEAPAITTCAAGRSLSTNGAAQIALPSFTGEVKAIDNHTPASALKITQTPAAGTLIGPGITPVTITVTDEANNASTCQSFISVSLFALKDFVVFSSEFTWLLNDVRVLAGSVGANTSLPDPNGPPDDKIEIEVADGVRMLQSGSNLVGDTIRLGANAQVSDVFYNELLTAPSSLFSKRVTPLSLPVLPLPVMPPVSPGTQDIEVQSGQTRTLGSGRYRRIVVKNRGTLILTGGNYELSSLDVGQEASIFFRDATAVRIKNEMDTDARSFIGPDSSAPALKPSQIILYAEGGDDKGRRHDDDQELAPTVIQIGRRNTFLANIYAPNGTVWLKSDTKATGAFVGKRARIGDRVELRLLSVF